MEVSFPEKCIVPWTEPLQTLLLRDSEGQEGEYALVVVAVVVDL